jgi:SAM-dependent methyltransferase
MLSLKLNKRNCPVCDSKKYIDFFSERSFKKIDSKGKIYNFSKIYVACKNCLLVYTNPTVNTKTFDKIYRNSAVGSFREQKIRDKDLKKIKLINNFIKYKYFKNKKILEIGCGQGTLLNYLAKKYKLEKENILGIEPSKSIFEYLKHNQFFQIKNIFLNQIKNQYKFDFIILDNVFEHFDFPNKALNKLTKILNKDGKLYISLPNLLNLNYNKGTDPLNHTCNYNFENLSFILNKNNFKVIKKKISNHLINLVAIKSEKKIINKYKFKIKKINNVKNKLENNLKKINKKNDKIIELKKKLFFNNEKIVVFGSGNYAINLINKFDLKKYIAYFVDNNKNYHKKKRLGIIVNNPKILSKNNFHKILICSKSFENEIKNQLKLMKVKSNKIIVF